MKDINDVFVEKIILLKKLSEELNFRAMGVVGTDLISISVMLDYKDGVFVGEIIESVSDQLRVLLKSFDILEEDQKLLKESFQKNLDLMSKSYTSEDKNNLFEALSNIRYQATKLQFKCYQTLKRKERRPSLNHDEGF